MKLKTLFILFFSHLVIGLMGFVAGIYTLPILTAPPTTAESEVNALATKSVYTATFTKALKGSDFLHWGEGKVSLGKKHITFVGELAPGPDYKLYLSPKFVETEAEFEQLKPSMKVIGDVTTFTNFVVETPTDIDLAEFNTVIVWCESFGEFITSAKYR